MAALEPFTYDDVSTDSDGLMSGIPSIFAYAELLISVLPEVIKDSTNEALEEHVKSQREVLANDPEYSALSPYYDAQQIDDSFDIEFGFFGAPESLNPLVEALEVGDAEHSPRAFTRRAVFGFDDTGGLNDDISLSVKRDMGVLAGDV